jgi:hypothetical protein
MGIIKTNNNNKIIQGNYFDDEIDNRQSLNFFDFFYNDALLCVPKIRN